MTGRDFVTASLRKIGAIAPGEGISAVDAADGLAELNRMLDSWSNESLLIYGRIREEFSLTTAQSYTMGPSGNFNTVRPQKIDEVLLRVESGTTSMDYPVCSRSLHEWASISQKGIGAQIPTDVYIDYGFPLVTLNLYPVPTGVNKLVLYSWKPLTNISTLDTVVTFPPGYEDAIIYGLAVRLSFDYGRPVDPQLALMADDKKASVKRMNYQPSYLRADDALVMPGRFNILTGGTER
jgi:hypothetical protein